MHDPLADAHKSGSSAPFSFWKPEPLPPKDATILPIELISLGTLNDVAEKLLDVPHMAAVAKAPWEEMAVPTLQLRWDVDQGVILQIRAEQGPPKPGEVLTINAKSATPTRTFYRLYVQIYEQFGATVLDEKVHEFLTPREFKDRLAS
jgi:hypothetical protein